MDAVLTFVTSIKNYLINKNQIYMAEKPKDFKKPAPKKHSGGEMSFGMELILFLVAIFVIWVLVGKPRSENADKPFIKGQTTNINN